MAESLICQRCQSRPRQPHFNAKWCEVCRVALRRQPASRVTPEQGATIAALVGTVSRDDIARRVGVSRSRVNRYCREQGLHGRSDQYPPEVVAAVTAAYEAGGKHHVRELFPDVQVRSIVERYPHAPRQRRWQAEELIEAARMAGLVCPTAQARYFGRPNAYAGSIKSLWVKVFQCAPQHINGLGAHLAWHLVTPGTPAVLVRHEIGGQCRPKVLWLEVAAHLRADVAPEIVQVIQSLAAFQGWLHGTNRPEQIRAMISEREANERDHTEEHERTAGRNGSGQARRTGVVV